MITTRNRCADLRRTLERVMRLNPAPDEILVTADGCSDGTVEMVRTDFSMCQLFVNEKNLGSIYSRDRMLRTATEDIVLSLDDDSYPVDDDFLDRLKECFARHPEVSVVTFPELRDDGSYVPPFRSPQIPGHYVAAYANGAAAMRRQDYLRTAGFPSFFLHAYEEPDYALQVYHLGRSVWFEPALTIRHHYSQANRDELRTHHLNARNEIWSVWMRCPGLWIVPVTLFRVLRQFCHAWSVGAAWVIKEPRWWWAAMKGMRNCARCRTPVPWKTYLGWMRMARMPIFSRSDLNGRFGFRDAF
ncbi:glycosyltransferase [Prosthecobacter sp. SYSU 5D2]|uniref:glycosyltransferase family 2 protein n=1 Tax=Prosthecobacter sp. SYSU 5D2 TaxID=3134134 RepID=UPI0031FEBDAE